MKNPGIALPVRLSAMGHSLRATNGTLLVRFDMCTSDEFKDWLVTSINSHGELVKALRELRESAVKFAGSHCTAWLDEKQHRRTQWEAMLDKAEQAEAALKNAGESQ
jgi:hypothetical protein